MTIKEIPSPDERSLSAEEQADVFQRLRRFIFGDPVASLRSETTLLGKLVALPVFCSDAISSVAYGTQQILLALCMAGLWLPHYASLYGNYVMTISWLIAILLVIVAASYWQTIYAYPNGGGSYIVSKDNLGTMPGLIAAAALLIDYVLTVSVSVASGLQNLKDVPALSGFKIGEHLVAYCLLTIFLITFTNLRGLKESGKLFAIPVYIFIGMCYLLIFFGLAGPLIGWQFHTEFANQVVPFQLKTANRLFDAFSIAVLLRAFANGCSAMTGTEAVSNGIPAFKEPKSANAAITLVMMATILGTIFMGVSWLAMHFHIVYWQTNGVTSPAVIDQLSGTVFGKTGPWSWAYILTQVATALILIIAAQTSFADFPRLSSILAKDGFMPRQFMNLGDKLAFNNGIILLGVFSSILIIMEKGSVDLLIPFFAIGVFIAFTMSQAGMVHHWFRLKSSGWQRQAIINGIGAFTCFIVVLDIAAEKFFDGAWFVLIVIGILLLTFRRIHAYYTKIAQLLDPINYCATNQPIENSAIVLIQSVHAGTLTALDYARSISSDCTAVYVAIEPERTAQIETLWNQYVPDIPLVILDSPYRSLLAPIWRYINSVHKEKPNHRLTVIIPEFVTSNWWQGLLHGNTGLLLKLALLGRHDVIVANVRYWLSSC